VIKSKKLSQYFRKFAGLISAAGMDKNAFLLHVKMSVRLSKILQFLDEKRSLRVKSKIKKFNSNKTIFLVTQYLEISK